jgi:hypothetical protein
VRNPATPPPHIAGRLDVPAVGVDPWWRGSSTSLSFCIFPVVFLLLF